MSKLPSGAEYTVRPASRGGAIAVFCVLGFVAAASVVFWRGQTADVSPLSDQRHTATAKIHRQVGLPPGIDASVASAARLSDLCNPSAERLVTHMTSEAMLDQAVRRVGVQDIAQARKSLRVTVAEVAEPSALEVAIAYTDTDADRCARVVNQLAESYATDLDRQWQGRTQQFRVEAAVAVQEARQALLEAQRQLDATSRQAEQLPPPTTMPPPAEPERPVVVRTEPAMVDNPEWLRLQDRLAQVKSRRDMLLIERTEHHPAVQDARMQVEELQQLLASIPRRVPGPSTGPSLDRPEESRERPAEPIAEQRAAMQLAAQHREEVLRRLREHRQAAALADEAYRSAIREERLAWDVGRLTPRVELDLAPRGELPMPRATGWNVLLVGLIAGMAGAVSLGMVSFGWAIEPTIGTASEAGNVAAAPVVGVVSESGPSDDQPESSDRRHWLRPILILGGLMLMGGSITMAINILGV